MADLGELFSYNTRFIRKSVLSFLVDNLPWPAKVLGLLPKNEVYFDWDDDIPPRYVIKYLKFWPI